MSQAWLIDKSALVRLAQSPDGRIWFDRIQRGLVSITMPTLLEGGYSAQSRDAWKIATGGKLVSLMPLAYLTPAAEHRALEIQGELAARGQHRAPSVADLLVAATAEQSDLTVLHLDKDFELIAGITGQPVERIRMDDPA
jgi:predicted nucleic acid-binding protein